MQVFNKATSSSSDSAVLSSEEFRSNLLQRLRDSGYTEKLKSQLRSRIILDLKRHFRSDLLDGSEKRESSIFHRVVNSLILEYCQVLGYEYTLAVFSPEAGIPISQALPTQDIEKILNLDKKGPCSIKLSELMKTEKERNLVKSISILSYPDQKNQEVQVCPSIFPLHSLESKLGQIDKAFALKLEEEKALLASELEDKMKEYREECYERVKEELLRENELLLLKEIGRVKLEEKQKQDQALVQLRIEFEKSELSLKRNFENREQTIRQRFNEREKALELEVYEKRQELLKELEIIRSKNDELKFEMGKKLENKIKEMEELKRNSEDMKLLSKDLQLQLERVEKKYREEALNKELQHERQISSITTQFEKEKLTLNEQLSSLQTRVKSNQEKEQKINELNIELRTANEILLEQRSQIRTLEKEKVVILNEAKDLREKCKICSCQEKIDIGYQKELQSKLHEKDKEIQKLSLELSKLQEVQKDLHLIKKERIHWQQECHSLAVKLDAEIDKNDSLTQQFEEEVIRGKEYQRDICELRLLLHQAQSSLNSELLYKRNSFENWNNLNETRKIEKPKFRSYDYVSRNGNAVGIVPRQSIESHTKNQESTVSSYPLPMYIDSKDVSSRDVRIKDEYSKHRNTEKISVLKSSLNSLDEKKIFETPLTRNEEVSKYTQGVTLDNENIQNQKVEECNFVKKQNVEFIKSAVENLQINKNEISVQKLSEMKPEVPLDIASDLKKSEMSEKIESVSSPFTAQVLDEKKEENDPATLSNTKSPFVMTPKMKPSSQSSIPEKDSKSPFVLMPVEEDKADINRRRFEELRKERERMEEERRHAEELELNRIRLELIENEKKNNFSGVGTGSKSDSGLTPQLALGSVEPVKISSPPSMNMKTSALEASGQQLQALERDPTMQKYLERVKSQRQGFQIVEEDKNLKSQEEQIPQKDISMGGTEELSAPSEDNDSKKDLGWW